MKHILRISLAILSASFIFSSCRTGTEPSVAPGMSAYIDGTYWVADSDIGGHGERYVSYDYRLIPTPGHFKNDNAPDSELSSGS